MAEDATDYSGHDAGKKRRPRSEVGVFVPRGGAKYYLCLQGLYKGMATLLCTINEQFFRQGVAIVVGARRRRSTRDSQFELLCFVRTSDIGEVCRAFSVRPRAVCKPPEPRGVRGRGDVRVFSSVKLQVLLGTPTDAATADQARRIKQRSRQPYREKVAMPT